jgi:integrase
MLTPSEEAELRALAESRTLPKIPRFYNHAGLQRLFRPLQDVLEVTQPTTQSRHGVLAVVTEEMLNRRNSYWSWEEGDWQEILGVGGQAFRKRYHTHNSARYHLMAVAYLLCGLAALPGERVDYQVLADRVFGHELVEAALQPVTEITRGWGYTKRLHYVRAAMSALLLVNRSPRLADLTEATIETVRRGRFSVHIQRDVVPIARALMTLGILANVPVGSKGPQGSWTDPGFQEDELTAGISSDWVGWCRRWLQISTLVNKRTNYILMLKVGRWLAESHPETTNPEQWTRQLAAEFVAAVDHMTYGQWTSGAVQLGKSKIGRPSAPRSKALQLSAARAFFRDCQEWEWIPRRFDARRAFAEPRSLRALIGPSPRVIADDVWVKLVWAGTNLAAEDLIANPDGHALRRAARSYIYPIEMVRAVAVVWLFAGLRANEIARLRVGCVRWQREDAAIAGSDEVLPKDATCMLDIPTHKTGTAFTKPVDPIVGKAIADWERLRPAQPAGTDRKTGERVDFLFACRGYRIATDYITKGLIPLLCRKAGLPAGDARGKLTSHRARSTIASLLFNAKNPMGLFELQEWLGHRSPHSTQHYAKITPTRLAKSYADADYFARNTRMLNILINRDAVVSGAAAAGEPWQFYDLGHGYCTYDFFAKCPHRMACAKCGFYLPKGSTRAQILEAQANLERMQAVVQLTDEERAAVEDGLVALSKLEAQLKDVATPAGPTPRELEQGERHYLPVIKGYTPPSS